MNKIKNLTQKYENILNNFERDHLKVFSASISNFYGLPKIHKSALMSKAIAKQNNEYVEVLEPSDPTCPTRSLSDLLDKIIKPFILHVKSYVRDNIDFLERYSRVNSKNTVLATYSKIKIHHLKNQNLENI